MRKSNAILGLIVLIIIIGGAYALLKQPSKTTPANSGNSSTSHSAPAVNNAVLITKTSSVVGQYLADPSGHTLYTYNGDSKSVSNCTGSCLASWPAYQDKGSTANLPAGVSTIKRTDNGEIQYTYNGLPLYYFISDPTGQVTGDGVMNFSVAKPAAASSQSNSSSTPPSNSNSSSNFGY